MRPADPCAALLALCQERSEREWLEFKVNMASPQEIGEYISALANSAMLADRDVAYLVFGIEDASRDPVGTKLVLSTMKGKGSEGLQNWIARNLDPPLMIEYIDFECDGIKFAMICVEPSYERPVKFAGTPYIRIGEHKKLLSAHPPHERALWLATARRKFEDSVAVANISESQVLGVLDSKVYFELTQEEVPKSNREVIRKLEKLGAVQANVAGGYDILNLGAILFAKDVGTFPSIKGKSVRVIKYKGKDKQTSEPEQEGRRGYAVGFEGLIRHIMQRSSEERIVGGVRRTTPLCPEIAVREVVANALIHQDFTNFGSGPVVEIYGDRIEVINSGNSLIEPDRMFDERKSRNEKLASAMRTLNLCEERGGGLDKALIAIEEEHLPAPSLIASADSMRVVLFGHRPFKRMTALEKQRACFLHCILRWIRHDYMNNTSLRERFGLPKEEYQAASALIAAEIKKKRIIAADPQQGKRNARYVPYWAR